MASFDSGDIAQLGSVNNTAAVVSFIAYTVPSGQKALILEIRSDNTTSTTHSITVPAAGTTLILSTGTALLSFQGKIVLAADETVVIIKASSNDVRTLVIGIEVAA